MECHHKTWKPVCVCVCVCVCYLAGSLAIVKLFGQEFNPLQHCGPERKKNKKETYKSKKQLLNTTENVIRPLL